MDYEGKACAKCGARQKYVTMHRFPLPTERKYLKSRVWAEYCYPGKDWSNIDSLKKLYTTHKMLCSQHFNPNSYRSSKMTTLNNFAIPKDAEHILAHVREEILKSKVDTPTNKPKYQNMQNIQHGKNGRQTSTNISASIQKNNEDTYPDDEETITIESPFSDAEMGADDTSCLEEEEILALPSFPTCADCGRAADRDGKLFQCVECPRVVCADCERADRHRQHCMLRLPSRAIYDKLKMLYESMRDAVVTHLDGLKLDVIPKDEPILELDPLNTTLTQESIQYYNSSKVNTDRLIENESTLAQSNSEMSAKSVTKPKSVLVVNCVHQPKRKFCPQTESAPEAKSLLVVKDLHKPTSVIEAKSVTQLKPTVNNLAGAKSVPGGKYVLLPKSVIETISVPKPILVANFSELKSETERELAQDVKAEPEQISASDPTFILEPISMGRLRIKKPAHDHSYSIISTSAAKEAVYKRSRPNAIKKHSEWTAKRKKSDRNDDEAIHTQWPMDSGELLNISEEEMTDEEGC